MLKAIKALLLFLFLFVILLFYKLAFTLRINMLFVATPLIFNVTYITVFIVYAILMYFIQKNK